MATKKKKKKSAKKKNSMIRKEIIILLSLAIAIILELSVFGVGGKVGGWIANVLFGLFGFVSYILPAIIFIGLIFLVINREKAGYTLKIIFSIVFLLALITLIQMIWVKYNSDTRITDYFMDSMNNKNAGGLVGGLLTKMWCTISGLVGAYVINTVFIIISIVVITEKSFLRGVKKGSQKVYDNAKEDYKHLRQEKQQVSTRRMDRKVERSVPTIDLKGMNLVNDDITEITPEELKNNGFSRNVSIPDPPARKAKAINEHIAIEETPVIPEEDIHMDSNPVSIDETHYLYPPKTFLAKPVQGKNGKNKGTLQETARKLQEILHNFGVNVTVTNVSQGPSVTRYELQPEMGTKVSRITSLADDIKLNLAAADIRIEAPIPGKAAVGIEVPNEGRDPVLLKELLDTAELSSHPSKIAFAAGKDISGKVIVADIAKMPHMLVAGTTGSGKSVFLNSIIMTILYRARPSEVRLIIIDPKVVEFAVYNGIPHLLHPIMTDPKSAAATLSWAVAEMTRRYQVLAEYNVRDYKSYNEKVKVMTGEDAPEKMPQILIVIDELADLMMVAAKAVEDSICRLAQLARAAGIHMIVATQRPSVDVVTGLIKANVPSRVALMVSSGTDSRTILDMNGAEKLLGDGDMLFAPSGYVKPVRVQGAFVSDKEIASVVNFLKEKYEDVGYDETITQHINSETRETEAKNESKTMSGGRDILFEEAAIFCIEKDKASASMLQRRFNIGFNRAARIIDQLSDFGVAGGDEGPKPRKILMTLEQYYELMKE